MRCLMIIALAAAPALVASTKVPKGAFVVPLSRKTDYTHYLAEFHIGTPPQKEYLVVDSGSPTVSFVDPKNNVCSWPAGYCKQYGTFCNTSSRTSRWINNDFEDELIDFGSGSTLRDTLRLSDETLPHTKFGYIVNYGFGGEQVALPVASILGLSLSCSHGGFNEACYSTGPYFLPQLHETGVIDRHAVSFYLGREAAHVSNSQMILGGAYDRAKQARPPFTVPMVYSNGQTGSVNVSALTATASGKTTRLDMQPLNTTLVDTGNPTLDLSEPFWTIFFNAIGKPTKPLKDGSLQVDCKYRSLPASEALRVEFGDRSKVIDVPFASLIIDFGNGTCGTSVVNGGPSSNGVAALSTQFIRNMYITFDYDAFEVTMAQARYTFEEDIVPLPKSW